MRYLTVLLFVLGKCAALQAQDSHTKPSPSESLAQRITKGIDDDSLKVVAIHDWITKNIKYDVNKFMRMNYDRVDEKTLVKKRKATCVGYADLFNSLCSHSGVQSVTVTGYSKNNYVDLGDTCYLQDHMWNAVMVNGRWYLVDATWDAGYVTFTQNSLLGKLMKTITGKEKRKYKPRFVRAPHKTYMMRDGAFFRVDHFPANPALALVFPSPLLRDFEQDSAYFFKRYPEANGVYTADHNALSDYLRMDPLDRLVADGLAAYANNPKNHFDAGIATYITALRRWHTRNQSGASTFIQTCDSVLSKIDIALEHHATADKMLSAEKKFLLANNERKATLFKTYLTETKTAISRNATEAKRFENTYASGRKSMKEWHNTNAKRMKALKEDTYFSSKNARVTRPEDSLKYTNELAVLSDSIEKLLASYRTAALAMDSLYGKMALRVLQYNAVAQELLKRHKFMLQARYAFYDDMDWEIIAQLKAFNYRRFTADSLLIENDTSVFRRLHNDYSALHRKANVVFQVQKSRMQTMKRIRTATRSSAKVDSAYVAAYDSLAAFIFIMDKRESMWSSQAGTIRSFAKASNKLSDKIVKALAEERKAETVNSRARNTYITKHIGAMTKENQAITNRTKKLQQEVAQAKQNRKALASTR